MIVGLDIGRHGLLTGSMYGRDPCSSSECFGRSHNSSAEPHAPSVFPQLEKPGLHPSFPPEPALPKVKCQYPLPTFPLAHHDPRLTWIPVLIAVGGFLPTPKSPSFDGYFPLPASLPTLHVAGRNDTLITVERSRTLSDSCENARVEMHDGGEGANPILCRRSKG